VAEHTPKFVGVQERTAKAKDANFTKILTRLNQLEQRCTKLEGQVKELQDKARNRPAAPVTA